jgi:hypothetical protein
MLSVIFIIGIVTYKNTIRLRMVEKKKAPRHEEKK